MKIIDTNVTGIGYTDHDVESLRHTLKPSLLYSKRWSITTEKRESSNLNIKWYYIVDWDSRPIFEFDTNQYFEVTEINIPPTDKELKQIVIDTHNYLHRQFDIKRDELPNLFDPVTYLSEDMIEVLASELRSELLLLQA